MECICSVVSSVVKVWDVERQLGSVKRLSRVDLRSSRLWAVLYVSSATSTGGISCRLTLSRWIISTSRTIEWPTMTLSLRHCESGELVSWVRKQLVIVHQVVASYCCGTKSISANTHSLKSVTSQSRKLVEPFEMEDSEVDTAFMPGDRDGRDIKYHISRIAMPNSLTSGTPGLLSSFHDTSRSIAMKIASTNGSVVAVTWRPRNCSAFWKPPSQIENLHFPCHFLLCKKTWVMGWYFWETVMRW